MKFCCECKYEYYHKDERRCVVVTVGELNPNFDCRYHKSGQKKRKITEGQIRRIYEMLNIFNYESPPMKACNIITNNLEEFIAMFPDVFKPKPKPEQEYCCESFKYAFRECLVIHAVDSNGNCWAFNGYGSQTVYHCPFCGKKPIAPIKFRSQILKEDS